MKTISHIKTHIGRKDSNEHTFLARGNSKTRVFFNDANHNESIVIAMSNAKFVFYKIKTNNILVF